MNLSTNNEIEAWEGEGGARSGLLDSGSIPMRGTPAQVEWAQRIKLQVNAEFDRVAASFRLVAARQNSEVRTDTEKIIAILEKSAVRCWAEKTPATSFTTGRRSVIRCVR